MSTRSENGQLGTVLETTAGTSELKGDQTTLSRVAPGVGAAADADRTAGGGAGPGTSSSRTGRGRQGSGGRESVWRDYFRKPSVIFYLALVGIMVAISFVGPVLAGNPISTANPIMEAPSSEYLLGTDNLGRDYLPWVLRGGQVSLLVGVSVAILSITIGLIVGGLAGFYGGFADTLLVKVSEFFQVLPGIVLALVAAALWGANVWIIVAILSMSMWPAVARVVRAECMRIAQLGYVESAKAAGFSGPRILWSDVIPNAMPPVIVATTMTVGRAILIESALAFLGIGDPDRPSWGALLDSAQGYMQSAWWLALFPGVCIFITVLAVNMLGDALNDSLNPSIGKVK